jgi:hypothetical protein
MGENLVKLILPTSNKWPGGPYGFTVNDIPTTGELRCNFIPALLLARKGIV